MKTKILKTLAWVGGLFLLTLFLISHQATAQSCGTPGYDSGDYYHFSNSDYRFRDEPRRSHRNGKHKRPVQRYNRNYGNYHHRYRDPFRYARIGTVVYGMPRAARRVNCPRGRALFGHRGFLWQEHNCPRRGRSYRAIDWY